MIKKLLLEYPSTFLLGTVFGTVLGFFITFLLMKTDIRTAEESYEIGYKNAQQECRDFIKNTK